MKAPRRVRLAPLAPGMVPPSPQGAEALVDALATRWPLFADVAVKTAVLAVVRSAIAEQREAAAAIATDACAGVHDGECRPCEIAAAIRARQP